MYNNYDYYNPYYDPNRPGMDFPRPMFHRGGAFGPDFYNPHPRFGRFPRPRAPAPISNWGRQLIDRQINKSRDRWLRPNAQAPKKQDAPGVSSQQEPESPTESSQTNGNGENKKSSKQDPGQEMKSHDAIKPAAPIPPKMSAKEMWESSYKEPVVIDVAKALNPNPVANPELSKRNSTVQNKQKKNKGRREPYYKRRFAKKKKTDAGSEAAASEPGFGFDVDGEAPKANDNSTTETMDTFPKMCKVCNAQLNGSMQAEQHYKGEAHKRNINKFLSGQAPDSLSAKMDKITGMMPLPTNTPECLVWGPDINDKTTNTIRFCRLCSVRMTSLQNAKQHYSGKSHAKRIRIVERGRRPVRKQFKVTQFVSGGTLGMKPEELQQQQASYSPAAYHQTQNNVFIEPAPVFNMKSVVPPEFSNSMTPSGQFYCQTCNITIENVGSLNSHLQSKAHKQAKFQMK